MKFFRKYHKWLGVIITLFVLIFALSGIVLNHRQSFSGINVNRNLLPESYRYQQWNNAAIKGSCKVNQDSLFIYGNTGIWLTDSSFNHIIDFNQGFPKGIDNRKIHKVFLYKKQLVAGTLFGLFIYNPQENSWQSIQKLPFEIMDINAKGDSLLVLTRSALYITTDLIDFEEVVVPAPLAYNNKVGLFKTLWVIHSGEIYGRIGRLFVDLIALVFIFLSITGLIYFLAPGWIKRKKKQQKAVKSLVKVNRFSLKWHNRLGYALAAFLILTTVTGMFLRPPLLIAIFYKDVSKIPFTELDTPNAWFDKLRRVIYDENKERYIFATIDGIYFVDSFFEGPLVPAKNQPPISVMGVNVFEQPQPGQILVGSFEGLFLWDEQSGQVYDYIEQRQYVPVIRRGAPIGTHMVAGFSSDFVNGPVIFDYNTGAETLSGKPFVAMPDELKNQPMSLWNLALEFHTMRIFAVLIGSFYILLIPLSGLMILFVLFSGVLVWWRYHRN